jgi:hypothetical protein
MQAQAAVLPFGKGSDLPGTASFLSPEKPLKYTYHSFSNIQHLG